MGGPDNISTGIITHLLDAKEVAEHLRLDVTLVRKMAKSGRLPALVIRNGARDYYRFHLSEVEEALRNEYPCSGQTT